MLTTTTPVVSVNDARTAGLTILESDDTMVAVYFELAFGEVVVTRDGIVRLASDYEGSK